MAVPSPAEIVRISPGHLISLNLHLHACRPRWILITYSQRPLVAVNNFATVARSALSRSAFANCTVAPQANHDESSQTSLSPLQVVGNSIRPRSAHIEVVVRKLYRLARTPPPSCGAEDRPFPRHKSLMAALTRKPLTASRSVPSHNPVGGQISNKTPGESTVRRAFQLPPTGGPGGNSGITSAATPVICRVAEYQLPVATANTSSHFVN